MKRFVPAILAIAFMLAGVMLAIAQTDDVTPAQPEQPIAALTTARAARGRAARSASRATATRSATGPAATRSATPAGRRGAAAASRPAILPDEFAILNTQNPFAHADAAAAARGARGATTGPSGGPEASIIFSGSMLVDSQFTAFLEDLTSKRTTKINIGDSIARGRIAAIDLDSLTYEANGSSMKITVGQNLLGQTPPPTTQPAGPQQAGAGQPNGPAAAAAGRRGSAAAPARGRGAAANPQPLPPDAVGP